MEPTQLDESSALTAAEVQPAAGPSRARRLFYGPNGLRAGYRLIIFLVLLVLLSAGLRQVRRAIWGAPKPLNTSAPLEPGRMIARTGTVFALVLLVAGVMAKIEKRPMRWYGMGLREAFRGRFWEGCLWGFASLSFLLLLLRLCGAFYFGEVATRGTELLKYGLLWSVMFILVGLFEEYLFRGYAQYTLTTGMGFWPAALVLSGLFTAGHYSNPGETWVGLVDVFLGGLVLALMLQRTGNLWFPIGFHAAWDWAQSFVYGVADSGMKTVGTFLSPHIPQNKPWWLTGGTVGPEGSILSACLELVLLVLVAWRFKRVNYPEGVAPPVPTSSATAALSPPAIPAG